MQISEMKSTMIVILALGLASAVPGDRSLGSKVNKSTYEIFHPLISPLFLPESLSKMYQCNEKILQCKIE